MLIIALAFGLALVAIIAIFGRISGAHVNPAVSIACLIDGRMSITDCVVYIAAQIIGACAGASVLSFIWNSTSSLGANLYETHSALGAMVTTNVAFIVELILTFVFVLVVLASTKKENCSSGLVIGFTLTLVHIFGIPFTGTSVNPARSIGPAIFSEGVAIEQLPLFIIAPIVGAVLAGLLYRFILEPKEKTVAFAEEVEEEMINEEKEEAEEEVVEEKEEKPKKTTAKKTTTRKTTVKKETTKK
jgi:aquaporin Z